MCVPIPVWLGYDISFKQAIGSVLLTSLFLSPGSASTFPPAGSKALTHVQPALRQLSSQTPFQTLIERIQDAQITEVSLCEQSSSNDAQSIPSPYSE